jgi:hypothetical protein
MKGEKIDVKGTEITIFEINQNDYLSLTDIARYKNPDEPKDVVKNWMRSKNTIEFIGLWEKLNNPDFKGVEFDHFIKVIYGIMQRLSSLSCFPTWKVLTLNS